MTQNTRLRYGMLSVLVVAMFLISALLPSTIGANQSLEHIQGVDKGVTYKPVVPVKRTTFVGYDESSYIDDYAYLSAVPTTVFHDKNGDRVFSSPLLFFQDEMIIGEEKQRSLNAWQGIDYFMDDWMSYSNEKLDQITLINVERSQLEHDWQAQTYASISGDDPIAIARGVALHDWSYTDNAVVAVIDDSYEDPDDMVSGTLDGVVNPEEGIITEHFEVPKTNEVYPQFNDFFVPEGYKFLYVRSWYPSFYVSAGLPIPGFENVINMSIPAGDRDLQIYCNIDGNWMMAGLTNAWNAREGMDHDKTSVYVYKSGTWRVALTDVPTKDLGALVPEEDMQSSGMDDIPQKHHNRLKSIQFGRYGKFLNVLKNLRKVMYQIDVEMYPGVTLSIPDVPDYGARNVQIDLSWDDPSVELGFSVIGPSGEEVLSTREPGVSSKCVSVTNPAEVPHPEGTEQDMHLERLGECKPGEEYSICVFSMTDMDAPTEFTIEYSWEYNSTRKEVDCLASATEGAVLASALNAPLLYTHTSEMSQTTLDTMYKLGVDSVYVVNIGGYLHDEHVEQLQNSVSYVHHYSTYDEVYDAIRQQTGQNDIIFSTVDPWSYWYVADLEVAGETDAGLSIGPAAYLGAQHGSPVILIDAHPELSTAVVWHNELWQRHPDGYTKLPSVSEMYLTGKRVYDFLKQQGYDKEGEETIVTIGGQFDIGLPWDRVFVGKARPGRFFGSPADQSVWLCKTVFYPQLVFENPVFDTPEGVTLINGSSSKRLPVLGRGRLGLRITKPSQEENFEYPVLDTLICYDHKFNSRASKYWGFTYECADGDIPGETSSNEPIDEGVMLAVNGQPGAFLADLSGSEVQPFYLKQAGYDPVYSTNFEANMHNLNQGVLMWMINTHGGPMDGGLLMFWDVENQNQRGYPPIPGAGYNKETNPWRGYEWLYGSTEEPDTMTMEIHGILPALTGNPTRTALLSTALDWALARRPYRDIAGKLLDLPVIRWFTPEWLRDTQDYYDGVIITVFLSRFGTSWYDGYQIDDALGNIHSIGVSSVACLPAGKYLHLTLMRHGSVFQIMDPWATSWYSDVWQNGVPRGIALGKTIGEIYSEGISKVGILYVGGTGADGEQPQWWWDLAENVCLYGDPKLRVWAPSTEFSELNYWEPDQVQPLRVDPGEGLDIGGHTPLGAAAYPHASSPAPFWMQYLLYIVIGILVVIALIGYLRFAVTSK